MSKRRVPDSERSTRGAGLSANLKSFRYAGISLSGGKNARTVVAVLDYFPEHKRLILSQLIDTIRPEEEISSDDILIETLEGLKLRRVAVDVPLRLPTCVGCDLPCPGVKRCQEPHIRWFWKNHIEMKKRKRNWRLFTPYTQRPIEAWLQGFEEEVMIPSDALGANTAPLTARMAFLLKRLSGHEFIEVFPRLSLWRIGRRFKIMKRYLRFHKHSVDGDKARLHILNKLVEQGQLFLYQQDISKLVQNGHAFDSLICALTAYYKELGETEPRPESFPKTESWIEIPL